MRPSDHHITPLPSTVNPKNVAPTRGGSTNPQLIGGGGKWGEIELHPPALPPSGDFEAADDPFRADRWGKVGGGVDDRTMRTHAV
jgi:hypothetical protein